MRQSYIMDSSAQVYQQPSKNLVNVSDILEELNKLLLISSDNSEKLFLDYSLDEKLFWFLIVSPLAFEIFDKSNYVEIKFWFFAP